MCKTLRNSVALLVLAVLAASTASAAPIVNQRSGPIQTQGSETSIQQTFDSIFMTPGALNAYTGQTNIGSFLPTEHTTFTYLSSIAAFSGSNQFWIYSNDAAQSRTQIVFNGDPGDGTIVSGLFSSSAQANDFGFLLKVLSTGTNMYSDDARNPGGLPQALVFQGSGQKFKNALGIDGYFNEDDLIIAFEDLNRYNGSSDHDFNDIIVLIERVSMGQPTPPPDFEIIMPEPASLLAWSLIAGVGGAFGWRRWRKNQGENA